jgi:hypothetical protein
MVDNSLSPDAAAAALGSPVEKETGPAVEYTAADESGDLPHRDIAHATGPARPAGWKYKSGPNFGLFKIPYYASPSVQLTMVAFVCFLCPGMFNALNGMGGGGKTDPTLADNMASTTKSPKFVICFAHHPRTLRSTLPLPSSVSSVVPLSTSLVSSGRWLLAVSGTAFTLSACWSLFTTVLEASTFSPALCLVSVLVFYGLPKGPS